MTYKKTCVYFLVSLFLLLFLVRCGGNKENSTNVNTKNITFTKAGKLGVSDIAIEGGLNVQQTPSLAFDPSNGRYLAVWVEKKTVGKDILGKWVYSKNTTSATQTYSFPVEIVNVVAYDNNGNEIKPQTVTGLDTKTVTVSALAGSRLFFFSKVFTVYSNVADLQQPKPAVAYGYDNTGNQNFVVIWSDYKNDGATINSPKLIGKVYDKNCTEIRKFYVAGNSTSFYTYSSSIYNLKNDVVSEGQEEPSVAFDLYTKKFVVAWVDINNLESSYRFAPTASVISNLTNTTATAESNVFSNEIVDKKIIVYRFFDISGNPLKDPNDNRSKRSVILYSDVDVESSNITGDITVNLNNIKSFKFEKTPKLAVDDKGNILIAFIGSQITSSAFFNYSSDAFPNTYINRGPFSTKVTVSGSTRSDIFVRNIRTDKDMEKKLFNTQLASPDKSLANADIDSFDITKLSDNKFVFTWAQNESGINKIKATIFDAATFTTGATQDVAIDKNSYNPKVVVTSNNEVLTVYERYDNETGIRDIYGRYLLQSLDADSDNFKVNTGAGRESRNPTMVADDSGRAFIIFENNRNNDTSNIFGTFYTRSNPLTKPYVFINYTAVNLGSAYIDSTVKKYLPVQNIGNGNLNITEVKISQPFQVISSLQTISPNTTKNIGIVFSPLTAGSFSSALMITTDDPTNSKITINVRGNAVAGVIIDTSNFKDKADLKNDYYAKLTATTPSQLQTNYEWSVVKGVLPDGISLDKNLGVLSGKATKTGVFEFEIKVKETYSGLTSASVPLKIEVYEDIAYAEKGSFKCFIATAAYGSYLDPHVEALRNFRDNVLLGTITFSVFGKKVVVENYIGKLFVKTYYKYSPYIASVIAKSKTLRLLTRLVLTPLVFCVKYLQQLFLLSLGVLLIYVSRNRKK